jgi:hypothetical protein
MTSEEIYRIAAYIFGPGLFILFCWIANRLVKNLDMLSKIQNDHEVRISKVETKLQEKKGYAGN